MAELRSALEAAGFGEVRTYIQSGNVIVSGDSDHDETGGLRQFEASIESLISTTFGISTSVIARRRSELEASVAASPFALPGRDEARILFMFLGREPAPERVDALDPSRSPQDSFVVLGREVHLWCPNGSGTSKLTADSFARTLEVAVTARNLRTVRKIIELMDR